jgi:hypothetical protein
LTNVKVVVVTELATNQYAHPLWHLISDSNSIPVKGFNYVGARRAGRASRPRLPRQRLPQCGNNLPRIRPSYRPAHGGLPWQQPPPVRQSGQSQVAD